jgi:hypothetical protein
MYAAQKRYSEAESLLQTVFQAVSTAAEPDTASINATVTDIVALYSAWDKAGQAAQWRAKLPRGAEASR